MSLLNMQKISHLKRGLIYVNWNMLQNNLPSLLNVLQAVSQATQNKHSTPHQISAEDKRHQKL